MIKLACLAHYASEQDTPRVQKLRHDYRRWLDKIDVRNLVFVDEAGLNLSMPRFFARAVDGYWAVGSVPGSKGGNVSLIGALSGRRQGRINMIAGYRDDEKGVGGRVWGVGNPIHKCRGITRLDAVKKCATRLEIHFSFLS